MTLKSFAATDQRYGKRDSGRSAIRGGQVGYSAGGFSAWETLLIIGTQPSQIRAPKNTVVTIPSAIQLAWSLHVWGRCPIAIPRAGVAQTTNPLTRRA
jgi:hypothetical protein